MIRTLVHPSSVWRARGWTPRSLRVRLTLVYSSVFMAAGGLLVGVSYVLTRQTVGGQVVVTASVAAKVSLLPRWERLSAVGSLTPAEIKRLGAALRDATLHQLLVNSVIALLISAVLATLLGWLTAGRVLRPLRGITATARRLSCATLDERIDLAEHRGELRELAETFNAMLARLQQAFDSQRRFVAHASHELRTPLAIQRGLIQVRLAALLRGFASEGEKARRVHDELLAITKRSEDLIDALLTLAISDRGLTETSRVELDRIVSDVAEQFTPARTAAKLHLESDLRPLTVAGDVRLLRQLVSNLVRNAIQYNVPGGSVDVRTGQNELLVANTGTPVPSDAIPTIFEPFHRLGDPQPSTAHGAGLGLSIVRSIATAHSATVTATPGIAGGLAVHVSFPAVDEPCRTRT